jgi:flagellar hook-associated protein 3 FlgL
MPTPILVNSRNPQSIQADRMGRLDREIETLGRQISVGERFTTPSEDPIAANRAALVERLQGRLEADRRSIDRANARLGLAEAAVVTAGDALMRARELALSAANGTLAPEDRQVIAREVQLLQDQLLGSANARDESGRHLFAGSRSAEPAYVRAADGSISWAGIDAAAGAEAAGFERTAPPNGPFLFGEGDGSAFAALQALADALAEPEPEARASGFQDSLTRLEAATNRLLDGQARIGAGMARLEDETERLATAGLQLAEALADAKGLDLTDAVARLDALKITLEAAQGSFVRIYDGTLFDRLG